MPYRDPLKRRECQKQSQRRRRARLEDAGTPERRVRLVSLEEALGYLDRETHSAWLNARFA